MSLYDCQIYIEAEFPFHRPSHSWRLLDLVFELLVLNIRLYVWVEVEHWCGGSTLPNANTESRVKLNLGLEENMGAGAATSAAPNR